MNVYFDHAATTSTSAAARAAALRAMEECWGNPSSLHAAGRRAAQRLDEARQSVARCLAASPAELYFTSGGTEADNWAITQCARMGAQTGKCHLITSAFEHHAVLHTMERLEQGGFEVTYLPVHEDGLVRVEELEASHPAGHCAGEHHVCQQRDRHDPAGRRTGGGVPGARGTLPYGRGAGGRASAH